MVRARVEWRGRVGRKEKREKAVEAWVRGKKKGCSSPHRQDPQRDGQGATAKRAQERMCYNLPDVVKVLRAARDETRKPPFSPQIWPQWELVLYL